MLSGRLDHSLSLVARQGGFLMRGLMGPAGPWVLLLVALSALAVFQV